MIKNFYTATDIQPGDIFVCTIVVRVQHDGSYRVYRCPWPGAEIGSDGTPQGDQIGDENTPISKIFPIIQNWAAYQESVKSWNEFLEKAFPILEQEELDWEQEYEGWLTQEEEDTNLRSALYNAFPEEELTERGAQAAVMAWRRSKEENNGSS